MSSRQGDFVPLRTRRAHPVYPESHQTVLIKSAINKAGRVDGHSAQKSPSQVGDAMVRYTSAQLGERGSFFPIQMDW
jgi:hypothetical protein